MGATQRRPGSARLDGGSACAHRVTRALVRAGHRIARCTVEWLMRELGIEGVIRGQRRRTTIPEPVGCLRSTTTAERVRGGLLVDRRPPWTGW
ncbi:IS3 family transposase [Streptomyces sp. NPDC002540]